MIQQGTIAYEENCIASQSDKIYLVSASERVLGNHCGSNRTIESERRKNAHINRKKFGSFTEFLGIIDGL
jgi:hypothetical protein